MEQTFDNNEIYNPSENQHLFNQAEDFLSSINSLEILILDLDLEILDLIFSQPNKKEKLGFFTELLKLLKGKSKLSAPKLDKFLKDYIQKLPGNIIDDEKRFNDVIFVKFLNGKLVLLTDLDEMFCELLSKNNSLNLQNTIIKLLTSLILEQHVLNPQNLNMISILQNILENRENVSKELGVFFEELRKEKNNVNIQINRKTNNIINADVQSYMNAVTYIFGEYDKQFYEVVMEKFEKWLLLSTENQITAYIHDLESSFVSKLDENFKKFFVYVIDICVNRALDSL